MVDTYLAAQVLSCQRLLIFTDLCRGADRNHLTALGSQIVGEGLARRLAEVAPD